jgi:hypothetical protein
MEDAAEGQLREGPRRLDGRGGAFRCLRHGWIAHAHWAGLH